MNTNSKIPLKLYRGDADNSGVRKLKDTIRNFQLQTNLINGGHGRDITEYPLKELIKRHVGIGWRQTHFLSFSSNIVTTFYYGSGKIAEGHSDPTAFYTECFEDEDYDFALITFHSDRINWKEIEPGIFEGLFTPSLFMFSRLTNNYRIILVDVVTVLTLAHRNEYKISLANAIRDKEWLLLPATHILLNSNRVEYSAILDGACISYKKYFSIQH